jgi:predicted nuclease of restriction endonuclease-like RecB superfamily
MTIVRRRLKIAGKSRTFRANQSWHEVAGRRIFFRSGWEWKVAKYLQFLKEQALIKEWEHEPETFWFEEIRRGTRSYLPDFKITRSDGTHYWVEVKGYLDRKSRTKIKRFRKYYPQEELLIFDEEWFLKNASKLPR